MIAEQRRGTGGTTLSFEHVSQQACPAPPGHEHEEFARPGQRLDRPGLGSEAAETDHREIPGRLVEDGIHGAEAQTAHIPLGSRG